MVQAAWHPPLVTSFAPQVLIYNPSAAKTAGVSFRGNFLSPATEGAPGPALLQMARQQDLAVAGCGLVPGGNGGKKNVASRRTPGSIGLHVLRGRLNDAVREKEWVAGWELEGHILAPARGLKVRDPASVWTPEGLVPLEGTTAQLNASDSSTAVLPAGTV